jgi:hypothetical protein
MKTELQMPISQVDEIDIDRAHRMGPRLNDKPRTIVAKFASSSAKDRIFQFVKNLRGKKQFSVQEQFPAEINERRKQLWPKFREAKADPNNKVRWSVDKLIINGHVHSAQCDKQEIPPEVANQEVHLVHTNHRQLDDSTYIGHASKLSHNVTVPGVLANIMQDKLLAKADHNIYAYRCGKHPNIREGYNDDGEHGAGPRLLKLLRDANVIDTMVITTRWFGGTHSGPRRFELIEGCASEALQKLLNPF